MTDISLTGSDLAEIEARHRSCPSCERPNCDRYTCPYTAGTVDHAVWMLTHGFGRTQASDVLVAEVRRLQALVPAHLRNASVFHTAAGALVVASDESVPAGEVHRSTKCPACGTSDV